MTPPREREERVEDGDISYKQRATDIRRMKADLAIHEAPDLTALEDRLYKHVVDRIDFGALSGLEELLWHALEQLGHGALDDELELARRMIERTIVRAAHDPYTRFTDVPYGIAKAEVRAVRFDAACLFCRYEHEHRNDSPESHEADHDDDELAQEWRAKHAEQLRRAGLAPGTASPSSGRKAAP